MSEDDFLRWHHVQAEAVDLDGWCALHLGAGVHSVLFSEGFLSTVFGVRLTSGIDVVVKIRARAERLLGCAAVHRMLYERGYPCPEPLVDLEALSGFAASAEAMTPGGEPCPSTDRSPQPFAAALAELVALAPMPTEVPSLLPLPSWTTPDFTSDELWPTPDDADIDLNAAETPHWIDESALAARARLAVSASPIVIGHGDFYTDNFRWIGDRLLAVWDWDSVIAASEPMIAGMAAAIYPRSSAGTEASVEESEAFLDAYQAERGRFSDDELSEAWAAGLWTRCIDAKLQSAIQGRPKSLTEVEASERCRRSIGR
jgi:Ser/Thr protein kinase RdoA (MazF antagonist)